MWVPLGGAAFVTDTMFTVIIGIITGNFRVWGLASTWLAL